MRARILTFITLLNIALCMSSGCVMTKAEGDALRSSIERAREQQAAEEQRLKMQLAEAERKLTALLLEKLREEESRRATLEARVEDIAHTTLRSDAAIQGNLKRLLREMQQAAGQAVDDALRRFGQMGGTEQGKRFEEMEKRLQLVEEKNAEVNDALLELREAQELPATAKGLFDYGFQKVRSKNFAHARRIFSALLSRFPKKRDLKESATFWTGETYYAEGKYKKAISEYRKLLAQEAKGRRPKKIQDAYFKIGFSLAALGHKEEAETFLQELLRKYPKSKLKKKANAKLKKLRKRGK